MGKRIAIAVLAVALAVGAPGCGGDGDGDGGESVATPESGSSPMGGGPPTAPANAGEAMGRNAKPERAQPAPTGTAIKLDDSQFGPVLFDEEGQAIYLFDKETTAEARCYGQCAVEWPPVLTDGEPEAQSGISQGKLGSVSRRDGSRQATYNGHPLYFYAHESPNEVRCHNIPGFGGLWLALNAEGDPA